MPVFRGALRVHDLRQQFRAGPHVIGIANIKPGHYEPGGTIDAASPYAAFFELRDAGVSCDANAQCRSRKKKRQSDLSDGQAYFLIKQETCHRIYADGTYRARFAKDMSNDKGRCVSKKYPMLNYWTSMARYLIIK